MCVYVVVTQHGKAYIGYIAYRFMVSNLDEKRKRTIVVYENIMPYMALHKAKMARRKSWLGKMISWSDVIEDLLREAGYDV